jgi:rRNA maturation endonuclease Nob1
MVLQMKDNKYTETYRKPKLGDVPSGPVKSNVQPPRKAECDYSYYSRVLNKPFDSVEELKEAEAAYYAEIKAKENKAAAKKADAQKVEDAFKALNLARKEYKEKLTQLTEEYSKALTDLKKAFEVGKADIQAKLAEAEDNYSKALKEFTDKHDSYHMCLKDGDFETTISGSRTKNTDTNLLNIFDLLFNF